MLGSIAITAEGAAGMLGPQHLGTVLPAGDVEATLRKEPVEHNRQEDRLGQVPVPKLGEDKHLQCARQNRRV